MAPVTMPPVEEAQTIFRSLGYTVSGNGTELVAERKWRTVQVTAMGADDVPTERALADGGRVDDTDEAYRYRCFVTWKNCTGDLRSRLERANLPYEWAIIGVERDDTDYVVTHGSAVA